MKYIIILLFLVLGLNEAYSQTTPPGMQRPVTRGYRLRNVIIDSFFSLPADTFSVPTDMRAFPLTARKGATIYVWNTSTFVWQAVAGGSSYTFTNGLTESPAGTVKLGGTLTGTTSIDGGNFPFTWNNSHDYIINLNSFRNFEVNTTSGADVTQFKVEAAAMLMFTQSAALGTTAAVDVAPDLAQVYATHAGDYAFLNTGKNSSYLSSAIGIHPVNSINYGLNIDNVTKSVRLGKALGINNNNFRGIRIDSLWQVFIDSLTNLSTQDQLVGIVNSSGQLGQVTLGAGLSLSSGVLSNSGVVTASNGLTVTSNNVKLGGALVENTTVTGASRTFSLSLTGFSDMILEAGAGAPGNSIDLNSSNNLVLSADNGNLVLSSSADITTSNGILSTVSNVGHRITSSATTQTTTNSPISITANSLTTGTAQYITSSSITTGELLSIVTTGTAAAAGNNGLKITRSGANATNAITVTGQTISVTNTNATSGTNVGLDLTASGATTANNALNISAGAIGLGGSAGTSGQVLTSAGANTLPTWSTVSGGSPAGNFGNLQINRNGAFATPGSDSLDYEASTGLVVKNIIQSTIGTFYGETSSQFLQMATATGSTLNYGNQKILIGGSEVRLTYSTTGNVDWGAGADGVGAFFPTDNNTRNLGSTTLGWKNLFINGISLGTNATPTALLHIKAGTASASTAPLKFTSGTNLTTAEAGAMEYNGTNLFFSPSTTRYTVQLALEGSATLDFGSTAASSSGDLTITVTGAADGDVVMLGVPNGSVNANSCFTSWVSAANTVTVRFNNYQTVGAIDPASGTFKVSVRKP